MILGLARWCIAAVLAVGGGACARTIGGAPLAVTTVEELALRDEPLAGRPIVVDRLEVTAGADGGGFFVATGDRHVFVLPEPPGITVATGDLIGVAGVIRQMSSEVAARIQGPARTNYDIYVYATSIRK